MAREQRRGPARAAILVLALAGASLAAGSCEGGSSDAGIKLRLELYGPPDGYPDPFESIAFLRVRAEGRGIETRETFIDFATRGGTLPSVPFGSGIQLTVEALDVSCQPRAGADAGLCTGADACSDPALPCDPLPGNVLARGRTGRFDVDGDAEARAAAVYMLRTDTYAPTVSASTGAPTQMVTGRAGHSVTRLEDGRVLIVGGASLESDVDDYTDPAALGTFYRSAEIYDPATGTFENLSGADESSKLFSARAFHQAVLLPDPAGPDRVAIFGGYAKVNEVLQPLASVEIFDPASGTFSHGNVPPMAQARAYHTATVTDERGRVLLVGGRDDVAAASWELWDPVDGPVDNKNLLVPRWNHTATLVPGSQDLVYIFGGENGSGTTSAAEIYNAVEETLYSGYFEMGGEEARTLHTASFVPEQGFVYVIGGFSDRAKTQALRRVDVFQVQCQPAGSETLAACWRRDVSFGLGSARGGHSALNLGGQAILVYGGCADISSGSCGIAASEIIFRYDRVTEDDEGRQIVEPVVDIGNTGGPHWPRYAQRAVVLESGHALILGGAQKSGGAFLMQGQAELFNPQ